MRRLLRDSLTRDSPAQLQAEAQAFLACADTPISAKALPPSWPNAPRNLRAEHRPHAHPQGESMTIRDIFIVSTARTAIGTFGGSLKDVPNTQLATTVVRAAIARAGIAADAVGHVVMGNVIPTDTQRCLPGPRGRD